ncbi:protein SERAC1 [Marchantia polymorpha subsp. ruderalis]|uniref:Protein SERAC1 n=1 Tax=Marchantia polymorpha subsp. ruderalis TaxID=1480154 RepID=A0AAF6B6L9_MARPO|nr:hypothetical protein Mp_4g05370 [Marchantia polymorpha subsp. ruderalis]
MLMSPTAKQSYILEQATSFTKHHYYNMQCFSPTKDSSKEPCSQKGRGAHLHSRGRSMTTYTPSLRERTSPEPCSQKGRGAHLHSLLFCFRTMLAERLRSPPPFARQIDDNLYALIERADFTRTMLAERLRSPPSFARQIDDNLYALIERADFTRTMLAERLRSPPPFVKRIDDNLYAFIERADFTMSIIFFHGPCNDGEEIANMYFRDWVSICQNVEVLWPAAWLPQDVPGAQIFSASYDLSLNVTSRNGRQDYYQIAENLLSSIFLHAKHYEMWSKPVVLVGHSLGGIVIKELLLKAHDIVGAGSDDTRYNRGRVKQFLDNIGLIYYYSTPHYGMALRLEGDSDDPLSITSRPSPILEYTKSQTTYLSRLDHDFKHKFSSYRNCRMATIAETAVTKWDLVGINHVLVPEGSWRVAGCQKYMASEADHFSVCKPTSKTSNNYINFLRNIEDLPIARPVPEAVVRLIVFKEDTFKKSVPSVDLYSLEDLKEQLENAPVEFKTRLVDSSEILTELVRLLSKEGWDDGWDADGRIRATTAYILYYLARVEKLRAHIGLYPKALRRLLNLLHMNVGELRKAALYALHVLARDGPSAAAICRREGALDHLVLLMISQKDKDLRVKAATTLAFATDKRRENQNSFLDLERAYKILVRILEEEQSPNLLYSAAHALANVPEYYSELAQQPQSLLTLAKLLEGNRRESKEQNEEEMVHRINIATIFQGITAGGANARHIATCKGVLENMVRVLQVTEDNPRPLQLSIVKSLHNISKEDYYLLKRIANFRVSRWLSRLEENLELTNMDAKFYISSLWQGLESMRFSCVGDQYEFGDEGVFTVKIEFYSQRGTNSQFRPYHSRTLEEVLNEINGCHGCHDQRGTNSQFRSYYSRTLEEVLNEIKGGHGCHDQRGTYSQFRSYHSRTLKEVLNEINGCHGCHDSSNY